jgi:hypothetical protein
VNAPKTRPILFSGPMVRAILKGRKTQTRRVVKMRVCGGRMIEAPADDDAAWVQRVAHNPYGEPGDRLWVRETFCIESSKEVAYEPPFTDGRPIRHHDDEHWGAWWQQPHYRATDPVPELEIGTGEPGVKWRPSIYMPRWASRITLEIRAVRVERLQDITPADAISEGCPGGEHGDRYAAIDQYRALWESINGLGSWDANPWVWVVEFHQSSQPAGEVQP